MKNSIAQLIKAQEIQKSINNLKKEIELMPLKREEIINKIEKTEKNNQSAEAEITAIEEEIVQYKKQIDKKNEEIKDLDLIDDDDLKSKNEREEKRKDLSMQIDNFNKKIEDCEEKKHKKIKSISSDKITLETLKAELIKEEKYIEENKQKKLDELASLEIKKKEILEGITQDIIDKFDRIIVNKGDIAIVPVYKNYCSGCNMILPFSLINRVKAQKEIIFCPYCSRMLYYEEEEIV
jgi:predicted  nucleic acid-binding Zn-ribbon protein